MRLGVRMRFGQRGSAQFDADTRARARASVSTAGGTGNGAWLAAGDVSRDAGTVTLNAVGSLLTNRAGLGVQQTTNWDTRTDRISNSRTAVRAGFAVAFADGDLVLGRPITDAFLIARPHETLAGKTIYLEPGASSEMARSGI